MVNKSVAETCVDPSTLSEPLKVRRTDGMSNFPSCLKCSEGVQYLLDYGRDGAAIHYSVSALIRVRLSSKD